MKTHPEMVWVDIEWDTMKRFASKNWMSLRPAWREVETGQFHIGDQVPYELVMKVKENRGL